MAGVSDCFSIGSIVACKTCYNKVIEGEVQAFDPQTKMLVLKCPASNNRPSFNNVYIVNLSLVGDVQVKKEVTTPAEPSKPLNLQRINNRVRANIEQKRCLIAAVRAGVTNEGMMLFNTISKTINEVTWQGPNIVIMNQVTITPPYTADNIKGETHSKAYIHIRKIVEKHVRDTQLTSLRQQQSNNGQASGQQLDVVGGGDISCSSSTNGATAPNNTTHNNNNNNNNNTNSNNTRLGSAPTTQQQSAAVANSQ
ncbi:hypothetical protein O3M35_013221 [Rhynocoris fuscipes]|uniref:LSM12 anticodon-binding domain-containing protein n=1 Tax=Rhynocoris fuscipes TaxID=488301 RepID=A0AAW1CES0_9HEMI